MKPTRVRVDAGTLEQVFADVAANLGRRLQQKGDESYAGPHEALGTITEEYHELIGAITENDAAHVEHELFDVATACLFAVASQRQKAVSNAD